VEIKYTFGNALTFDVDKPYSHDKAIWWYTREFILYSISNRALHCRIAKLHSEQFKFKQQSPFEVYRGQSVPKSEFE